MIRSILGRSFDLIRDIRTWMGRLDLGIGSISRQVLRILPFLTPLMYYSFMAGFGKVGLTSPGQTGHDWKIWVSNNDILKCCIIYLLGTYASICTQTYRAA